MCLDSAKHLRMQQTCLMRADSKFKPGEIQTLQNLAAPEYPQLTTAPVKAHPVPPLTNEEDDVGTDDDHESENQEVAHTTGKVARGGVGHGAYPKAGDKGIAEACEQEQQLQKCPPVEEPQAARRPQQGGLPPKPKPTKQGQQHKVPPSQGTKPASQPTEAGCGGALPPDEQTERTRGGMLMTDFKHLTKECGWRACLSAGGRGRWGCGCVFDRMYKAHA